MDPVTGNGAHAVAQLVFEKWFAAMGLVGLLLFVAALLIDLPMDRRIVICIALMMLGYGFGQAECRTFQVRFANGYKITGPTWRWTVSGALLFALAAGATVWLATILILG